MGCICANSHDFHLFLFSPPLKAINSEDFNAYLHNANYCIAETTGDGFCYMNAVQKIMALDYNKYLSIEDMQSEILCHLIHNNNLYCAYHEGDIAKDCELFFKNRNYIQSIVDVIVQCAPAALKFNQYIYQEDKNRCVMRVTEIVTNPSHNNIHLYFDYNPNYPLVNHYKAIVKTNGKIKIEEFEPHIHSQVTQEEKLGNIGNINYESYSKEYRFPTHLFLGLTPTPVDFIPGNIDGLKLYKLCNVQPKDC